jgi:hypothetical protein
MDELKIDVRRVGGLWHGTIEGYPEIDERGLTEAIARRKVEDVAAKLATNEGTRVRESRRER